MIIFIAILSVLILFHELGHFLAAKRQGIRVEKFSLGSSQAYVLRCWTGGRS